VSASEVSSRGPATLAAGAVAPVAAGAVVPLGGSAVRITGGLLGEWQRRNRYATIPHVIAQLRVAGNVTNLSRLLDDNPAPYQGRYPFLDTDLYKTLEGIAYELAREDSPVETRAFYQEIVTLLGAVQAEDGYLNSRYQDPDSDAKPWSDLTWSHEFYNLGHLIQAAVAAHRQLGDDRLLEIACRFADLVVRRYGDDGEDVITGHPEAEMALAELYRTTGNRDYLRQAQLFVNRRGHRTLRRRLHSSAYMQDHRPLREMESVTGHAVRMTYLAAGAADVWLETGDETLGVALRRLWDDMVARKLYITGGLGSRHSDEGIGDGYELPSERAYSETCAAIGTMQWAWRMFIATGEARYLDTFETVLYNAFAVGLAADGRGFFYDNPLQRRADHDQRSGAEEGGEALRRGWFGCPCCPPNVVRWMSQLGDYLAAERAGAMLICGYASASIAGSEMTVSTHTAYPWDGEVRMVVEQAPAAEYSIMLRVPSWARDVLLDGTPATVTDGWVTVRRRWHPGDQIGLTLPMPVRYHGSHPYLDATRGALAVARGPLLYCAEQQDCAVSIDDLVIDANDAVSARVRPAPGELPGALVIETPARMSPPASAGLYPELLEHAGAGSPTWALLIPYFLWGNREPGPMRVWIRRG
jgi:uncharacterized protein